MASGDPKVTFQEVSLAPGATREVQVGSARAFYFSPALTLGNTLEVSFGLGSAPFKLSGFDGCYVRLGGPVDTITIRNTGAGTATGQVASSTCAEFLLLGM